MRAALVSSFGEIKATSTRGITTYRSATNADIFEQSTTDIWAAVARCTGEVLKATSIESTQIKGLGFDATCSLAVCDLQGNPLTITAGPGLGDPGKHDVILWADHRASEEAKCINLSGSEVLKYVGGMMSVRRNATLIAHHTHIAQLAGDGNPEDTLA